MKASSSTGATWSPASGQGRCAGVGWAVLGGFLLTATKNWVQVRGYHGVALMYLVAAWLFERIGMWSGGGWPSWLFELSNNLFLGSITAMLAWTLLRYRKQDD